MRVLFWIARNKINNNGLCPIYARVTINGKRCEIATNVAVKPIEFDNTKKKVKSLNPFYNQYNKALDKLAYTLNRIYIDQTFTGNNPTPSEIKDIYTNKLTRITELAPLMADYAIEKFKQNKSERIFKLNNRYIAAINKALNVCLIKKISIDDCNALFYDKITNCFYHKMQYSASYIRKITGFIKSALTYAYNRGFTSRFPISYKVSFANAQNIVYLTDAEIKQLAEHRFNDNRLQKVSDCFLVQCYTGLSYIDLKNLSADNIIVDNNHVWINIRRQKVQTSECVIPVLSNIKDLLHKYNYKLPVISNQQYNKALKEIGNQLQLSKNLTTHVGRKTFATLLLNKNVPIETVSALLGHSNTRITQKHYAKVLNMKIVKDLQMYL
jgi:integrase/recombinase XerD